MIHVHRFALLFVTALACAGRPPSHPTGPTGPFETASSISSSTATTSPRPGATDPVAAVAPDVCTSFGGPHCEPCRGPGCPAADAGLLCCHAVACVVAAPTDCATNQMFWCSHYSSTEDPATGIPIATCHDSAD